MGAHPSHLPSAFTFTLVTNKLGWGGGRVQLVLRVVPMRGSAAPLPSLVPALALNLAKSEEQGLSNYSGLNCVPHTHPPNPSQKMIYTVLSPGPWVGPLETGVYRDKLN